MSEITTTIKAAALALAAAALAACGGGGGGVAPADPAPSGSQTRVQDMNLTHAESSDRVFLPGSPSGAGTRFETSCDASGYCRRSFVEGVADRSYSLTDKTAPGFSQYRGMTDQSNGWTLFSSDSVAVYGVEVVELDRTTTRDPVGGTGWGEAIGAAGRYSFAAADRQGIGNAAGGDNVGAFAMGQWTEGRPPADTFWRGAAFGYQIDAAEGAMLAGDVVLAYSIADNMVDVGIQLPSFPAPRSFFWENLPVNASGEFNSAGIEGDFYGPGAAEAAGFFERGSVFGAWLAVKAVPDPGVAPSAPSEPSGPVGEPSEPSGPVGGGG